MHYIAWTLIAMFGYALMLILLKFSLRTIPPEVAVIITNTLLVVAAIGYAIFRGASLTENIGWNQNTMLLVLCGMALSVAIISQYIALSRGPVSVVGPLFGMNVAVVAVLGVYCAQGTHQRTEDSRGYYGRGRHFPAGQVGRDGFFLPPFTHSRFPSHAGIQPLFFLPL